MLGSYFWFVLILCLEVEFFNFLSFLFNFVLFMICNIDYDIILGYGYVRLASKLLLSNKKFMVFGSIGYGRLPDNNT